MTDEERKCEGVANVASKLLEMVDAKVALYIFHGLCLMLY